MDESIFNYDDFNTRRLRTEYASQHFSDPGHYIKDHCFILKDGRCHLFYIRGRIRKGRPPGGRDEWIGHASTRDLSRWKLHEPLVQEGAPFVILKDGLYYLFYNRESVRDEYRPIRVATSEDLFHWTPRGENPVYEPSPEYYRYDKKVKHCRDFHVIRAGKEYYLFFTGLNRRGLGCVGVIRSRDLLHWEDVGPIFELDHSSRNHARCWWSGYGNPESPFIFKRGRYWHMLFTDNSFSQVYHLWSERMLAGWSWERGQKLWLNKNGFSTSNSATEILEMHGRQFISYYFHDLARGTYSLGLSEIGWKGPVIYLKY